MSDYIILPFQFKYFNDNVLLVNQAGEFIFLNHSDFEHFYSNKLTSTASAYKDLKQKHFLTTQEEKKLAIDLLSTKLRTRKNFISDFTSLHMIVLTLRCNCLCSYCHASSVDLNNKNFDMNWEIAKKTIDIIFQTPNLFV